MNGLLFLENMEGGQIDLVKKIAKVGYNDTPLFSMIQKAVPSNRTKPYEGHTWQYEEADDGDDINAYPEGSAPATAVSNILGVSKNHYQIIKHTYGVTGSTEYAETSEGQKELQRQGVLRAKVHRKTIEKALFKAQAPVQRAGATVGRMGGLLHWATVQNTIDAAGANIQMQMLRELLKIGWSKGVPTTHIFVNDKQKDKLDDLLETKVRVGAGGKILQFTNYTEMKNMPYVDRVKIILSPYVEDNDLIALNLNSLALVYHRLTHTKDIPTGDDVVSKQLISELTLRVNNPYAVTRLQNLGV